MQNEKILSAYESVQYAVDVIKNRWPEAEEIIKSDPICAYWYSKAVIKGRWPEAEETIKTVPLYAYAYAKDVIKCRWLEAEEIIINSVWKDHYTHDVINQSKIPYDILNSKIKPESEISDGRTSI